MARPTPARKGTSLNHISLEDSDLNMDLDLDVVPDHPALEDIQVQVQD
jgi:hypothetical protein